MTRKTTLFLSVFVLLSFFLHFFKSNQVPACLNADEAAYGYNAYSILKTGKDEYGVSFPLRLKSFGDYKLPLYSYITIPSVAVFGLTEFATRLPAALIGILFPLVMYAFSKRVFEDENVSLLSSFLVSVSPWFQITSRHAHEALLATFFVSMSFILFMDMLKKFSWKSVFLFLVSTLLSLFSYHFSRIFAVYFLALLIYFICIDKKNFFASVSMKTRSILLTLFVIVLLAFSATELRYAPTRIANLIFYNNPGFRLRYEELKLEHSIPSLHNNIVQALIDQPKEYLRYWSPEFLVITGDENPRFGFEGVSPITIIEYIFMFVGLYYVFKNRERHRYMVFTLLLFSPLSASLSWQSYSLNRAFFLIVPLLSIVAYGAINLASQYKSAQRNIVIMFMTLLFFFSLAITWDFYFYHYPKRATVINAWQCGYKELVRYIQDNYDKYKKFYITTRHGQPYIFLLFYGKYPPDIYQKQAFLSEPDEFGFGQVQQFDKFDFRFNLGEEKEKETVYIGYPEHFLNRQDIDMQDLKKIKVGTEEIFWIYESK